MSTTFQNTQEYAEAMDQADPLRGFRDEFLFPQHDGKPVVYFTGNSLGLQPRQAKRALQQELDDWGEYGVEGHFDAQNPWYSYHERFTEWAAELVGAKPEEVVLMNGLTTNLHLMMTSFYRPEGNRRKIICEAKAFPSDQYAVDSQARSHGLDPEEVIVEVAPRKGEHTIRLEDVLAKIHEVGEELALVMIGTVNYYSGQLFDMQAITQAAHGVGAFAGFDLAHAAGNVPLDLHAKGVDFAVWCSYKYLNSGPGGIAGAFIHGRHLGKADIPRFEGWWGHDKKERFKMERKFKPMPTAEAWQLSNAPIFTMAVHHVALEQFHRAGLKNLREKSILLTGYLEYILQYVSTEFGGGVFEVITPSDQQQRGAQLSVLVHGYGKKLFDALTAKGVMLDWREPNVIRMAPVPIYNSFQDVQRFGSLLQNALKELA